MVLRKIIIESAWRTGWVIRPLVKFLGRIIPKKNGLVIVGSRNGFEYMDNSRYLYEWLSENHVFNEVVWHSWRIGTVRRLRQNGYRADWLASPICWWRALRAEVGIYSNRLLDLAPHPAFLPANIKLVALGHGVGVKGKRLTRNDTLSPSFMAEIRLSRELVKVSISSSPFVSDLCAESQGVPRSTYRETGYPRTDVLLHPTESAFAQWTQFVDGRVYRYVRLYAPTWRAGKPVRFFPFPDFCPNTLGRWLIESDTLLLLRPHIRSLSQVVHNDWTVADLLEQFPENVRMAGPKEYPDPYELLPWVDELVTDYSSLYHDFLLLDRPMYFVPYDYEEYSQENGFQYDFWSTLPGAVVQSQSDFISIRDNWAVINPDATRRRKYLRDRIHCHKDGNACQRIADCISRELLINESFN